MSILTLYFLYEVLMSSIFVLELKHLQVPSVGRQGTETSETSVQRVFVGLREVVSRPRHIPHPPVGRNDTLKTNRSCFRLSSKSGTGRESDHVPNNVLQEDKTPKLRTGTYYIKVSYVLWYFSNTLDILSFGLNIVPKEFRKCVEIKLLKYFLQEMVLL